MEIYCPPPFRFQECLVYLGRSPLECCHTIENDVVWKLLELEGQQVLIGVRANGAHHMTVEIVHPRRATVSEPDIAAFVRTWFDLETPLSAFYQAYRNDDLIGPLIKAYDGLRLICIPDLFHALCWAIIGQQINLTFAYQVKRNLVRHCANFLDWEGRRFYRFPKAEQVLRMTDAEFKTLQFSRQKTAYVRAVAEQCASGELNKEGLLQRPPSAIEERLLQIKGVGRWTAHYVMLFCLQIRSAFPVQDVGLHQAIQHQLALDKKPSTDEVVNRTTHWTDWQGYATYYLWRSLRDPVSNK